MSTWPTLLDCRIVLGTWTETPQRNVVTFQPEVGPAKNRRRSTAAGTLANVTWKFSKDQLHTFLMFYRRDIKDGSLPFYMNHPITDDELAWMFEKEPDINSQTRNFHTVSAQLRSTTQAPLDDITLEELGIEPQ